MSKNFYLGAIVLILVTCIIVISLRLSSSTIENKRLGISAFKVFGLDNITLILTFLTALSSLIAAVYAAKSVKEMQLQRYLEQRPYIILEDNKVNLELKNYSNLEYEIKNIEYNPTLVNIGKGHARNISVIWELEENLSELIASINQDSLINCPIYKYNLPFQTISLYNKETNKTVNIGFPQEMKKYVPLLKIDSKIDFKDLNNFQLLIAFYHWYLNCKILLEVMISYWNMV